MKGSLSIAELFAEHTMLAMKQADLDRRIQALGAASVEATGDDAIPRIGPTAEASMLWMHLDEILRVSKPP